MKPFFFSKILLSVLACSLCATSIQAADQTLENKVESSKQFNKEIQGTHTWIGASDEQVNYSNNSVKYTGTSSTWQIGGALGMNKSYATALDISGYGEVLFDNNNSESTNGKTRAAAIAMGSNQHTLKIYKNTEVSFQENFSTAAKNADGAAIHVGKNANADITGNVNVTFKGNVAESTNTSGNAYGSILLDGGSSNLNISGNTGHVLFEANKAISAKYRAHGGAIAVNSDSSVACIEQNAKVSFVGNVVKVGSADSSGVMQAAGGAIYEDSASFSIKGNTEVVFDGNSAVSENGTDTAPRGGNFSARGGAIYSTGVVLNDESTRDDNTSALSITDNTKVSFTGNYVQFNGTYSASNDTTGSFGASGSPKVAGGAIYANNGINIQGNDNVSFSGNYEKTAEGYRLRAIYATNSEYTSIANDKNANYVKLTPTYLSANEGGVIEFQDGITLNGNSANASSPVHLNSKYGEREQTGKIVFTGRYTKQLLDDIKAKDNAGAATDAEVNNSRRFEFNGAAVLNAGTLSVEDQAFLSATDLTVKSGATLAGVLTLQETESLVSLSVGEAAMRNIQTAAVVDSNVALESGSALTLHFGNFSLNNNELLLGNNIDLSITLSGGYADGDSVMLFSNVSTVNFSDGDDASQYFVSDVIDKNTTIHFNDGNVYLSGVTKNVPEPTGVLLSFVALMSIAGRRRRR